METNEPLMLKVSKFHSDRLHIEIPKEHRDNFVSGEPVWVEKAKKK